MSRLPIVAIVGRPNVGKSTLFNRVVGARESIVHDQPGLTRDRKYAEAFWAGRSFQIVDTGGWEAKDLPTSEVSGQMREQALTAIDEADATILLVDVHAPDHPVDAEVIELLRRRGRPFLLAVNRCDNPQIALEASQFYAHGVDELFAISALNGGGTGDLLDAVLEQLPEAPADEDEEGEGPCRVAVVGRPNVGKSTIVNQIIGQPRVIASPAPGTTRDAIDLPFRRGEREYVLVDTAGIRRRGAIERGAEKLCAMAALLSMERCDVALLLIDGPEGLTDQDKHVAGYAVDAGCALIIVVNKWDIVEKDHETSGQMAKKIRNELGFVRYAPILFVSALTGQRVVKIFEEIDRVAEQHARRLDTSDFNELLRAAVTRKPPPVRKNRPLRVKYGAQVGVKPPHFVLFCNDATLMHFSYRRYLTNQIRREFGFEGTPIRLSLRSTKRDRPK